jgi:hypothetical protein
MIQLFVHYVRNILRLRWKSLNWIICGWIDKWEKIIDRVLKKGVLNTSYLIMLTRNVSFNER